MELGYARNELFSKSYGAQGSNDATWREKNLKNYPSSIGLFFMKLIAAKVSNLKCIGKWCKVASVRQKIRDKSTSVVLDKGIHFRLQNLSRDNF